MVYQYFLRDFLKCIQNNLEYLIQNTIHLVIEITSGNTEYDTSWYIPCWCRYFKFIVIVRAFYVFPCVINAKI